MKKKYVVKKAKEFNDMIKKTKPLKNDCYIIYSKKNNLGYDRFGISVGKKLGNAVFRNKYKRKLRNIIDDYQKLFSNSKDYIIIVRGKCKLISYLEMKEKFNSLMAKGEDVNEKK